jgi:Domain of unknown function (DUF4394)
MIKRPLTRHLMAAVAASAVALSVLLPGTAGAAAEPSGTTLYGLTTGNRIVTLDPASPLFASRDVAVSGLLAGEQLIGIDRRPKTGAIYGVGRLGTAGRLYTVDPSTGGATFVAALVNAPSAPSPGAPIALTATSYGFDFNPVADALRIVGDNGQNLRVLPSDRAAGVTGTTFVDGTLNAGGATVTGVSAAAYTNNVAAPVGTTLFDLDTRRDLLVRQDPPNAGTLVTVGSLRFPAGSVAGFDIVTTDGVDTGYAALTVPGAPLTLLARIDLATGQAKVSGLAAFPRTLQGLTT